ncbi:MAG: hypothetical protein WA192_16900 [Candidatus Acidiferrales bacterium]
MFQVTLDQLREALGLVNDNSKAQRAPAAEKSSAKPGRKSKKLGFKSLPAVVNMKRLPNDLGEP